MSIAIAIEVGSPVSQLDLVQKTIGSIMTNIGTDRYKFVISVAPFIDKVIKDYIYTMKENHGDLFDLMPEENYYWADFINEAIDRSQDYKYFIKSHDDIELLTPGFWGRIEDFFQKSKEPAGWVSFTDREYLNGYWAPPTRPGFHIDHVFENGWMRQKLFQFHSLPENWWRPPFFRYYSFIIGNIIRHRLHMKLRPMPTYPREYYENLPYDFPEAPVKCHAPFNHFVLIEMDKLRQIGKCEQWQTYNALLVDEDWGLRALQLGFNNVWIPDIAYIHHRPGGGNRSWFQIVQDHERVYRLFFEKWGFHSEGKAGELAFIKEKYAGTNIPWSIERRSYEWNYLG